MSRTVFVVLNQDLILIFVPETFIFEINESLALHIL